MTYTSEWGVQFAAKITTEQPGGPVKAALSLMLADVERLGRLLDDAGIDLHNDTPLPVR